MIELIATIFALSIAVYGFLLTVGGGTRYANRFPRALGRLALDATFGLFRGSIALVREVFASVIQYVFDRPRR